MDLKNERIEEREISKNSVKLSKTDLKVITANLAPSSFKALVQQNMWNQP